MSLFKISESIKIGFKIAVIPRTDPILKIFDPIRLPTEIPSSFFAIATRDAANFYWRYFHETPVITMSSDESEAVKYFSNTFLAYKVAYFNKIFDMCEKVGMDYKNVVEGVTADSRIGTSHTRVPGIDGDRGFGGTCFPKDINSLIVQLEKEDINADMFKEIWKYNQDIRTVIDWTVT